MCIHVLFALCATFLLYVGKLFKINYQKSSVIVNLYIQGSLLLISGFLPLLSVIMNFFAAPSFIGFLIVVAVAIYASFYLVGYLWMLRHYHHSLLYAFNTCVNDLQNLSARIGISYQALNLLIFVVGWLGIVSSNIFFALNI